MREGQSLQFAGDVSVDKVKIITSNGVYQDITAQVITIQYYEDLFSPFISGSLIVKDALDLVNLFPFAGEEFVELEISTPALQKSAIKGRYYIYKLSDRDLIGDNVVVYQLHFISLEAIIDLNKKISKVFTGNVANIVKSIVGDKNDGLQSDKTVYIEETTRSVKFISNFWSPVKCINYLTEFAVNANSAPSFVFFENRDGFYFVSLDSMYASSIYQDFIFDKYTRDDLTAGRTIKNPQEDFKRITSISIPVGFDYMDRIRSGTFASKSLSYDLTNKRYNVRKYNMFEKFDKLNHLNKYSIASEKAIFRFNSLLVNYPRALNTFNGFGDTTNYKNFQERISLLKQAESNKIEIVVPGRTDYTVGQKVSVTLHKVEPHSKDDNNTIDKMFSGFYLVSAINHYITRESHECNMELIKDSLQINLDRNK